MLIYAVIISLYLFIGGMVGVIINLCLSSSGNVEDHRELSVISGVFWPLSINVWAGYYFSRYIIKILKKDKK